MRANNLRRRSLFSMTCIGPRYCSSCCCSPDSAMEVPATSSLHNLSHAAAASLSALA